MGVQMERCPSWVDRMIYQRHVGEFLVFPVGGVRFNVLLSNRSCDLLCMHVGLILVFEQTFGQVVFVLLNAYLEIQF
jgi:hypothetical protein